ncbi:MAG: phosphoribosylanthranilate isomerase [Rhodoplanes sp.]
MAIDVKICGLSTRASVEAAVEGRARFLGFVFFPGSPRHVAPARVAELGASLPAAVIRVGLLVDPTDDDLVAAGRAGVDMLQLHGSETAERVADIKMRLGLPVIKAVAVADADDLDRARIYESVADRLLFDARPPKGATRPGGNALAFDWRLLRSRTWSVPWMLAGGLCRDNLEAAIRASAATAIDVSSGVEDEVGVKSTRKIRALLALAATLDPPAAMPASRRRETPDVDLRNADLGNAEGKVLKP